MSQLIADIGIILIVATVLAIIARFLKQPIVLGYPRRSRGGCKGFLLTYSRRFCIGRKNQWEAGMKFRVGVDTGSTIEWRMTTVDEEEVPQNCQEEAKKLWWKNGIDV